MSTYLELFSELLDDDLTFLFFLLKARLFSLEKFLVATLCILQVLCCATVRVSIQIRLLNWVNSGGFLLFLLLFAWSRLVLTL